jgi:hypothetical protein
MDNFQQSSNVIMLFLYLLVSNSKKRASIHMNVNIIQNKFKFKSETI